MWPGRSFWKVDGRKRDYSILIGRRPVNVKPAIKIRSQTRDSRSFQEVGAKKARTSKKEWKWQRGIVEYPLSGSQWNRGHFSMRKWESEKHKSWGIPAEGLKGHVAIDGSLLGNDGKWRGCGWAVVRLDYDKEMGPPHGMYGSMEAEIEVQRTIKRAELTAFLCFLRKVSGPIKVHVDNKGTIGGLRKGEKLCVEPRAADADW